MVTAHCSIFVWAVSLFDDVIKSFFLYSVSVKIDNDR